MRARKRCPYCRCLYLPDARCAKRQWACNKTGCQQQRRRETQRRYRNKHPEEAAAGRIRRALAAAKAGVPVAAPTGPPAALGRFPWEEVRDEISPQVLVIAKFFVRLVMGVAKDEIRAQVANIHGQNGGLVGEAEQDQTAARAASA